MRNRFNKKWYGKTNKLGFTLLEVLVAIAILALLAIPLAQSMITSAQINSQSKNIGAASDMAQTVAESMQATPLGNVLTEINGYTTNSVGYDLFNEATGEGYSFLNNALQGYTVEEQYEVMLLCANCKKRINNEVLQDGVCSCGTNVDKNNVQYVPVTKQNDTGVQSDADVTSSIKTRTTTDNIVRTYFTGNVDDTYDFVLKNIQTEESQYDVLVHVEPEQTLQIADISSMSSSDLVNIVEKKNLDADVAETFFQAHQLYCSLRHTATTMTVQDFQAQMVRQITIDIRNDAIRGTTVLTVKAVYTAPDGTVDVADKYITKTVGSFTTNSTAELADGVYFYYYPLRGNSRDVIIVNNPDNMSIKVYLILMNDGRTEEYSPVLKFSDLTPANAANTTTFCSNHPEDKFAELPAGVHIKTLSNTTEQQTLYSMNVKVFTHKESLFDENGIFTPNNKYLLVDTEATLLDSSERFDVNVDTEFGNPIPEEPEGGEPGDEPGEGDDDIELAPNRGYSEAGGQNFVYSGEEYDVTKIGGKPDDEDAGKFVEWSGQTKATDAGVYYAYAKPIDGHTWPNGTTNKRQITWTIARKPAAIIEAQNAIYDGLEHLGYNPDTTKTNYVSMTGDVTRTDAGHYTMYVTPDPNYSWLDDESYGTREVTWTISPCPVTLTWKTGEGFDIWQYDGDPHSGICEIGGLKGSDTPETVKPNIRDNRIIEVGKVTAKVTSLSNPNYALPTQGTTHDLTVWGAQQSEIVMKPAYNGVVSMIYNGKEQTGVEFSVGVAITGTTHAIDAGTYTIVATPLPGYAWDAAGNDKAPRPFEWQILQKEVTVKWGDLEWDYDGIVHKTTCEVTNLIPNTICDVTIHDNHILDAGTQDVFAELVNKNYKFPDTPAPDQSPNQTLIVHPLKDAEYHMSDVVVYDGQTHIWGTGSHVQVDGTLSKIDAGTYEVKITPTKNHTWADGTTITKTERWIIEHAELSTVSWNNYAYTGDNIVGVTNKFCDWGLGQWQATNKGTYTIEVTPSKNYAWANNPDDLDYTYTPQDRRTRVITWKIVGNNAVKPDPNKAILNFGDPILTFEYNGQTWSPHISTVDGTLPLTDPVFTKNPYYTVEGVIKHTEACPQDADGNYIPYVATIKLKDKSTTTWSDGTTNDIRIEWYITRRKITLQTIPHQGNVTYREDDAFDGDHLATTVPAAHVMEWTGRSFQNKLKLKVASSATGTDGDIWLIKDEFPQYDFDYKASILERAPLAAGQKINFACAFSPNIINNEVSDYDPDFNPLSEENLTNRRSATCAEQSNAGIYYYNVIPTILDVNNKNVTHNYDITYEFSYLVIHKSNDPEPVEIIPQATVYNGQDQNLVVITKAPTSGTIEFLWEAVGYKASSDYNTPAKLQGKKSVLPGVTTGFDGYSAANPGAIRNLVGEIDYDSQQVIRESYAGWTATIPNGTVESKGTVFSTVGTPAGGYIVYYRIRGDANHADRWDPTMKLELLIKQSAQTIIVNNGVDKCHNYVSSSVGTKTQENPAITYGHTNLVQSPTLTGRTASSTNVARHTKAVGTHQTTRITTNGSTGSATVTIYAAATENYKAASATINVTARPHLQAGLRDSLNHLDGAPKTYPAKCTTTGNKHYICLECGATKDVEIPKLGHNYSTSSSGGTWCTTPWTHTSTCSRCGDTHSYNTPAQYSAHQMDRWGYHTDAQHARYCSNLRYQIAQYHYDEEGKVIRVSYLNVRCRYPEYGAHRKDQAGSSGCCYKWYKCGICGCNMGTTGSSGHHNTSTKREGFYQVTRCGCCNTITKKVFDIWG